MMRLAQGRHGVALAVAEVEVGQGIARALMLDKASAAGERAVEPKQIVDEPAAVVADGNTAAVPPARPSFAPSPCGHS